MTEIDTTNERVKTRAATQVFKPGSLSHTSVPSGSDHQALTTHGEELTAVIGAGSGIVNVTPTAVDGSFSAQINVNVPREAPERFTSISLRPPLPTGTRFDVMFRPVDSLASPSNELRIGCFTVTVR
ncbi:MAG TPA: hypothetical protein VGZ27_01340 [Vicinamibacterales bacterium]|nr:hypothetical protein [Vicinamibacterales bacterium]